MGSWPVVVSALVGYLIGIIQPAFFIGKVVSGIDIREHGSNNAGASNVTTVLGWKYGVITAIVDILKGFIPVLIVRSLYPGDFAWQFLAGAMAVVGHIYPFYLGFHGGKGAASLIGMALAIDFRLGLLLAATIVGVTILTDYIALGSLAMYSLLTVWTYLRGYPRLAFIASLSLLAIAIWKHRTNIQRIRNGTERGLRSVVKKSD